MLLFRSIDDVGPASPLASSLAAGFSGAIAAALSHSFDTAKTRSQCIVIPKVLLCTRYFCTSPFFYFSSYALKHLDHHLLTDNGFDADNSYKQFVTGS